MTKNVFAYIRVSTNKQGEGVSLDVQKEVIERYATSKDFKITKWFKEKKSASKGVRPAFNEMITSLYDKKAEGCIFHKIDRISRNDLDWHTMNMLADAGYDICSASENLNLRDNAARFTADIQSVVAVNYSRNLSVEAKKGLYGRLRQGYFPFYAPLGYLNKGKGKTKAIDKNKAPLVKKIFELYTERGFSVSQIVEQMKIIGLLNKNNNSLTKNGIIAILKNPFYMGLMLVKGDLYKGNHTPLISSNVFEKAKRIMKGKSNVRVHKHNYLFRRMIRCEKCNYRLVGEKQKGNVYYRCHRKNCLSKTIREETLVFHIKNYLSALEIPRAEIDRLNNLLNAERKTMIEKKVQLIASLNIRIGQYDMRLDKLTDALIDGMVDKEAYQSKRQELLLEQLKLKEEKSALEADNQKKYSAVRYFLELLNNLANTYDLANFDEKQDLLKSLFSNLVSDGNRLVFPMVSPFVECANRDVLTLGGDNQTTLRTNIVYTTTQTSAIVPRQLSDDEIQQLYKRILDKAHLLPVHNVETQYEL